MKNCLTEGEGPVGIHTFILRDQIIMKTPLDSR